MSISTHKKLGFDDNFLPLNQNTSKHFRCICKYVVTIILLVYSQISDLSNIFKPRISSAGHLRHPQTFLIARHCSNANVQGSAKLLVAQYS